MKIKNKTFVIGIRGEKTGKNQIAMTPRGVVAMSVNQYKLSLLECVIIEGKKIGRTLS